MLEDKIWDVVGPKDRAPPQLSRFRRGPRAADTTPAKARSTVRRFWESMVQLESIVVWWKRMYRLLK